MYPYLWGEPRQLLQPLALVITGLDLWRRRGSCQNVPRSNTYTLVVLDRTPSHRRCWCSMAVCREPCDGLHASGPDSTAPGRLRTCSSVGAYRWERKIHLRAGVGSSGRPKEADRQLLSIMIRDRTERPGSRAQPEGDEVETDPHAPMLPI